MSDKIILKVQKRTLLGKKAKKLKQEGWLLANVSIPGKESIALKTRAKDFKKMLQSSGESGLIYLEIDDKAHIPVLIEEIQSHPVTACSTHVYMKKVDLKEKVESEVPIKLLGEFDVSEANMLQVMDVVKVRSLPTDIPSEFEIDLSQLTEIGQSISLDDLKFDKSKIELVLGEEEDPSKMPIVMVEEIKEEEPEPEPEVAAEGEEVSESEEGKEGGREEEKKDGDEKSAEAQNSESKEKKESGEE